MRRPWLLLIFFYLTFTILAEAKPVFGPKELVRSAGRPQDFAQTFANTSVASEYKILVKNGLSDGSRRVSSARIWLNGALILGPSDFNQQISEIRQPVTLLPNNEIKVTIAGSPGGILTISISAVVGVAGGFVGNSSGARITIPSGVINGEVEVSLEEIALSDTGIALPAGYSFMGGVSLDISGAELAAEAELAIPVSGSGVDPIIAARVIDYDVSNSLTLVDTASLGQDGLVHTDSPPFPGVRSGGVYLFARMPQSLGIVGVNVRSEEGSAVKGSFVNILTGSVGSNISQTTLSQALESQSVFVGQSDDNGFAGVPGIPSSANLHAIVTASGTSPSEGLIGLQSFNTPNQIPPPPTLANIITVIVQRLITSQSPPPTSQPCPCSDLTISPSQIPPLSPNQQIQLGVVCGSDNVTVSTTFNTIQDFIRFISLGINVRFTAYQTTNPNVLTVSQSGLLTAVGPGSASVKVFSTSVKWPRPDRPPRICVAFGSVGPIDVTDLARLMILKVGSKAADGIVISLLDSRIDCDPRCEADFNLGETVILGAGVIPDSDAVFIEWGGGCAPCGTSSACPIQIQADETCTARFECPFTPPNDATLISSRDLGSSSMLVPRCGNTIKIWITVPNNMISGSGTTGNCGRGDIRVSVRVCPPNSGCTGFTIQAGQGQGLDICHDFDQILGPFEIINPRLAGTQLIFDAVTEKQAKAKITLQ
jgi:hypothetical protein